MRRPARARTSRCSSAATGSIRTILPSTARTGRARRPTTTPPSSAAPRFPKRGMPILLLLVALAAGGPLRVKLVKITNAKHGVTIAIPEGWKPQVDTPFQVIARGKEGGLKTHLVEKVTPERAVRGFFADSGEPGEIHVKGPWTCTLSRAWWRNPQTDVVVCARQLEPDWVIVL